jgi:hypothetical protein
MGHAMILLILPTEVGHTKDPNPVAIGLRYLREKGQPRPTTGVTIGP